MLFAVTPDPVPDGRRTIALRRLPIVDRLDDPPGIGTSGAARVDIRNDGRDPHRGIEQAEQWEAGNVDLARLNSVELLNLSDLMVECAVAIEDTLCRAGAAGGENNRGRVFGGR